MSATDGLDTSRDWTDNYKHPVINISDILIKEEIIFYKTRSDHGLQKKYKNISFVIGTQIS